jgi:hypothetical protein
MGDNMRPVVISFFDYTGAAVEPWANAGFECYCFDIQHDETPRTVSYIGGGSVTFERADLSSKETYADLIDGFAGRDIRMVFGFPPCTDLAVSGARHWQRKREADPMFQERAILMAVHVATFANAMGVPYAIENPVGALCTQWRKPDHKFQPYFFGGYLSEEDAHPLWPNVIPARDAYTKATCLWTGNGFVMPEQRPVVPVVIWFENGKSGSPQWAKLGGKSLRTKNIRSATPRGFAQAVFEANVNAPLAIPAE